MKKAILIDSNYGSISLECQQHLVEQLKECGIELTLYSFRDEDDIISAASDSEMVICTGNPPVTRKVMENFPKLKCVLRTGVGVNSVDIDAATELNKVVLFMPGFCAQELATHATALILALNRNLRYYDSRIRKGEWPKAGYSPLCKRDDVVLTCHSAFFGEEASANQVKWAFEMTRDFLSAGAVIKRRVANRKVLNTLDGLTVKG